MQVEGAAGGRSAAAIEATGVMPMPPAISSTGSSPAGASCSGKSLRGPSAASVSPSTSACMWREPPWLSSSRRTPRRYSPGAAKQPASGVSCTSE